MNDFTYLVPTKVIFGKTALEQLGIEIASYHPSKILVLYGSGSVVKNGILGQVTAVLDGADLAYVTRGGVKANPLLSFAHETVVFALEQGIDFVLAVGGGSVIDTAKSVAMGIANPEVDIWTFYEGNAQLTKTIPVATVLTISAAGSETSDSTVLTNVEIQSKRGFTSRLVCPVFSIMNPEFTHTLPTYQVACGVVDIMMHTLDRYFAAQHDNELTNQMAEGLLRTMMMYGKRAVENPCDAEAMSEIMWCGSVSHTGFTGLGAKKDFAPHQLSHGISAVYDATHGASLSVCWGGFANYVYHTEPARFARYARNVIGLTGDDDVQLAQDGIRATKEFFASLGMPLTLTELLGHTPTEEEIAHLTTLASFSSSRTIGTFQVLRHEDIQKIYQSIR